MTEPIIGIYRITHVESGRVYVGSSRNVAGRWRKHQSELNLARHKCRALLRDYQRAPELRFELLEACEFEVLGVRERGWITDLKRAGVKLYNEVLLEERKDVSRVAEKLWEIDKAYKANRRC